MSDNTQTHCIEIDSVAKSYGDRRILSSAYLHLKTGDICALFGRNGTGKSTLQRIIFGSLKADHKFIRVDGEFVKKAYTQANLISYLPDDTFIPSGLKVKEALSLYGIEASDISEELIVKSFHKRVSELSSGELRFLEIYIILKKDVHFVLLDEAFKFLSPIMIERVLDIISQESLRKGILIADHRYKDVMKIANRILLIKDETLYELKDIQELERKGYIIL